MPTLRLLAMEALAAAHDTILGVGDDAQAVAREILGRLNVREEGLAMTLAGILQDRYSLGLLAGGRSGPQTAIMLHMAMKGLIHAFVDNLEAYRSYYVVLHVRRGRRDRTVPVGERLRIRRAMMGPAWGDAWEVLNALTEGHVEEWPEPLGLWTRRSSRR